MGRVAAPDWPAMMRRPLAAAYCGLNVPEFEREVAAGRLSPPVILGGSESWSREQLDEDLGSILGRVGGSDWERRQPGLQHG